MKTSGGASGRFSHHGWFIIYFNDLQILGITGTTQKRNQISGLLEINPPELFLES